MFFATEREEPKFGGIYSLYMGKDYKPSYPEFDYEPTSLGLSSNSAIQSAYQRLQAACLEPEELGGDSWLSTLQATGWLELLNEFLTTVGNMADRMSIDNVSFVLVEDDGPDRVCIISSLVQLVLDPYYRSVRGFAQLVQKEWIHSGFPFSTSLGHKRDGSGSGTVGAGERASFQLFLDAVYQLLVVNPCSFEFTCDFLSFLGDHTLTGLFGTFIGDDEKERSALKLAEKTVSIWSFIEYLLQARSDEPLLNPLYASAVSADNVLIVPSMLYQLQFWEEHYLRPSIKADERLAVWSHNHELLKLAKKVSSLATM